MVTFLANFIRNIDKIRNFNKDYLKISRIMFVNDTNCASMGLFLTEKPNFKVKIGF